MPESRDRLDHGLPNPPSFVRVRVLCATCGEQRVSASDFVVTQFGTAGSYSFVCPSCHRGITREVTPTIRLQLLGAGFLIHALPYPRELDEHDPTRPALTPGDLLDFTIALEREGWVDELLP